MVIKFIEFIGSEIQAGITHLGQITIMFFAAIFGIKASFEKNFKLVIDQMVFIGYESLPMTTITGLSMGMVLVVQIGAQFHRLGAQQYVGGVVGLALTRELAPVMAAIVITARVGSAIAAELGSMKVTEQIDALKSMAVNPVHYLIIPRLVACTIMLPILTIYTNFIGIAGGALVAVTQVKLSFMTFKNSVIGHLAIADLTGGILKSLIFGMQIALIGCYMGYTTEGGAEGVGIATTRAVVASIIAILVTNYFLTVFIINVFDKLFTL